MRNVREILRRLFERGLRQRQSSASTGVSKGAVSDYYMKRPTAAGVP
jgi:predicted transcriptional regulator